MERIAAWIARILEAPAEVERAREIEPQVREMCAGFPLFSWSSST